MPKMKMPTVNTKDLSEKVTKAFSTARNKARETTKNVKVPSAAELTKTMTMTLGMVEGVVSKKNVIAAISKLGFVTRKEYEALEARIEQLEGSKKARKSPASTETTANA